MHLMTVVRHSREYLATVRASHDSRETFARVSYDVRANFIISQLSLEMVLFMSQSITLVSHICRMVQIAETKLLCVCERLRRVDTCEILAIV